MFRRGAKRAKLRGGGGIGFEVELAEISARVHAGVCERERDRES